MATSSNDSALRACVDAFVADLSVLIRQSALDVVREALGGSAPAKRGPGRPPKAATAAPAKPGRRGKRAKRDPAAVIAVGEKVLSAVKAKPGQSVEEIGKSLGMPTKALKLPILKLLAGKKLKTKGQRRGTKYFSA